MQDIPLLEERYEITASVARGGMAHVFRGVSRAPASAPREVAIKRLLPSFRSNERFQAMFVEEARVVADLQHANIASFYELCHDDAGMLCIVMEWVDGVDLSRMLIAARDLGRTVSVPHAAYVGSSVLRALGAAHQRPTAPVFHRDVSPANILVSRTGDVKLTDFGLARAMDRMTVTLPGVVVGKMAYVAPELIAASRATAGSDIYSLGVVLWEMLAGRRLFQAQNELELFMLAGRADIPPLEELRADVPRGLADLVRQMTHKAPQRRLSSAREAAEALAAFAGASPSAGVGAWAQDAHAHTAPTRP
ncbi:MAG: serine/threonine-protein kinase [Polyangiales bacterium]